MRNKQHSCRLCNFTSGSSWPELQSHINADHLKLTRPFVCAECGKRYQEKKMVAVHADEVHANKVAK